MTTTSPPQGWVLYHARLAGLPPRQRLAVLALRALAHWEATHPPSPITLRRFSWEGDRQPGWSEPATSQREHRQ